MLKFVMSGPYLPILLSEFLSVTALFFYVNALTKYPHYSLHHEMEWLLVAILTVAYYMSGK